MTEETRVKLVSPKELAQKLGPGFVLGNTVLVEVDWTGQVTTNYFALRDDRGLRARNEATIKYCEALFRRFGDLRYLEEQSAKSGSFVFQGGDTPHDLRSVGWQRKHTYEHVCLVPDFYYVNGWKTYKRNASLKWEDKISKALWRGSTTGSLQNQLSTIRNLPRYKLCKIGKKLGAQADFAFTNIVQEKNENEKEAIRHLFIQEDILTGRLPFDEYEKYKLIVQIDGNGNNWELFRKLLLGSCLLLVDSDWQLWHNRNIQRWEHYVPIKNDLTDLEAMIDWCFRHEHEAEKIGFRGRQYALSVDFASEMDFAAKLVFDHLLGE